jgi:transporter family protein
MNWVVYALFSAFFAALTAILAKVGVKDINSNLATAIRTLVIMIFAWAIVFFQSSQKQLGTISKYSLVFLVFSGITTGISWLFYFKALQTGDASKVAPIDKLSLVFTIILAVLFLKEKMGLSTAAGAILMSVGAVLIALGK